jgi:8-oxo-dGTP diphosphatase
VTRYALQFGQTQHGLTFMERQVVHGICARAEHIAIVRLGDAAPFEYDLPGGGVESEEDEAAALMREFSEETGLTIWPERVIGRAGQYWIRAGEPRNNLATFYEVELSASDSAPTEPGHALVWMTPAEAALKVRHEAHGWAILHWLRARRASRE